MILRNMLFSTKFTKQRGTKEDKGLGKEFKYNQEIKSNKKQINFKYKIKRVERIQ